MMSNSNSENQHSNIVNTVSGEGDKPSLCTNNNDAGTRTSSNLDRHAQLLEKVADDPRIDASRGGHKIAKARGGGRNTESFDPKSTLVRPDMRIIVGPNRPVLDRTISHDDVLIIPEFFCAEDDWSIYYKLVEEMRAAQSKGLQKSEWISWHEGAHLISNNPTGSPTYRDIQARISKYFGICNEKVGTRFNWYKDGTDWKPFHHDSAAFNPQRARNQNITVGVSFGSSRELAFLHAHNGSKIYFPQTNGMMFSFGRDVNIQWKHGVNALSEEEIRQHEEQAAATTAPVADGTPGAGSARGAEKGAMTIAVQNVAELGGKSGKGLGRISIILWGLCPLTKEEDHSPALLTDNTRGNGHSIHHNNKNNHNHNRNRGPDRGERGGGGAGSGSGSGGGGGGGSGGRNGHSHNNNNNNNNSHSARDRRDGRGGHSADSYRHQHHPRDHRHHDQSASVGASRAGRRSRSRSRSNSGRRRGNEGGRDRVRESDDHYAGAGTAVDPHHDRGGGSGRGGGGGGDTHGNHNVHRNHNRNWN